MIEQNRDSRIVANQKLGNSLKFYELGALEGRVPVEEVSFHFNDTCVFPGFSGLQLERLGLVEQREDRCYLTGRGVEALREITGRPDSAFKLLSGADWELSSTYSTPVDKL